LPLPNQILAVAESAARRYIKENDLTFVPSQDLDEEAYWVALSDLHEQNERDQAERAKAGGSAVISEQPTDDPSVTSSESFQP
jgi:hypothetical protein